MSFSPVKKKISKNRDCLLINDIPFFPYGGDLNYARTPRLHWRDRLLKMKAAGMNTVTLYVTWDFHQRRIDAIEWSGDRDLGAFLDIIHEEGMYAITRHGPFVHAEWRNGGLPQWLIDRLGKKQCRTNNPDYLEYARKWYEEQMAIIVPRLATRGGPIIMVQLENELGSAGSKGDDIGRGSVDPEENARHVLFYYNLVKERGVDVPIIDISCWPGKEEKMQNLIDTGGSYPVACFGCDGEVTSFDRTWWEKHKRPYISIETGSSMFVRFFDFPPYKNTRGYQGPILNASIVEDLAYQHLGNGFNGINFYMMTDGRNTDSGNERMLPERDANFQSPITSIGSLRESYRVIKRLGWLLRSFGQEMLRSEPNFEWATVYSYGKAHPGSNQTGDLFDNYHRASAPTDTNLEHVTKLSSAGRCVKGFNLSDSNFLILRNTYNHGSHWLRDIRIETSPRGIPCETFREYPVRSQFSMAPNTNRILPFYVFLQDGRFLEYSTGGLLDRRAFGDGVQLLLYGDAEETLETAVIVEKQCPVYVYGESLSLWESPNTATLMGRPGCTMNIHVFDLESPLRIVHLEKDLAGQVWDLESKHGSLVAVAPVRLLTSTREGNMSRVIIQTDCADFPFWLLTPSEPGITGIDMSSTFNPSAGLLQAYGHFSLPTLTISWKKWQSDRTLIWEAEVDSSLMEGLVDLIIFIKYKGSHGKAYLNGNLVSDHYFGKFLAWEIGLRDFLDGNGKLRIEFRDATEVDLTLRPVVEKELIFDWSGDVVEEGKQVCVENEVVHAL